MGQAFYSRQSESPCGLIFVHKTHARVLPCFENSRNVETTGYFLLQDRRAEWDYSYSGGTAALKTRMNDKTEGGKKAKSRAPLKRIRAKG